MKNIDSARHASMVLVLLTSSPAKYTVKTIIEFVTGHRKQQRVTEYQQNCFLFLAFIDAR